jgi:hypothetical protein
MRFSPSGRNFQLIFGPFLILMSWAQARQWQHQGRDIWTGIGCLFFAYAGLETIWRYFAIYWETGPSGLYCHRLLRHRLIPFNEILRIEQKIYWWDEKSFVNVEYAGRHPSPRTSRLLIYPKDREALMRELSERAPSAIFIAPMAKMPSQLLWWRRTGAIWGDRFATFFMQRRRS